MAASKAGPFTQDTTTPSKDSRLSPPPSPASPRYSTKSAGVEPGWYAIANSNRYHSLITNQYWECFSSTRVHLQGAQNPTIPSEYYFTLNNVIYEFICLLMYFAMVFGVGYVKFKKFSTLEEAVAWLKDNL